MEDYDQLMGRELESSPAQPSNETGGRTSSPLLSPSSTNRGSGSVQTEARSSLRRKRTSSPGATEEGIQTDSEQTPFKRLRLTEDGMQYHEQIMGTLKLKSAESQQLLKMYLQATPALQTGLMFGVLLSLKETDSEVQKVWEIPQPLLKNIRAYGFAMILAPGLGAYKANSAKSLLGLLYKHSLAGLPPETDRARSGEVSTRCSTVLGECRSAVKGKLIASIDEANGNTRQDIGELCEELVKGTDIVLTIQHHARIAWLRLVLCTQKVSDGSKFWDEVDACLKEARQKYKGDTAEMSKMFSKALKLDHMKYGKPVKPCPTTGGQEWQTSIEKAALSLVPYKKTR